MGFQITNDVGTPEALERIGLLVDVASELDRPEGTKRAIELVDQCLSRPPTPPEATLLHYFSANAWAHLQAHTRRGSDALWDWEQPEIERQLTHLRQAACSEGYQELPPIRQCQIATNLGNLLSHVGRFVDAVEYWDGALHIDPDFAMALANRGHGLIYYGLALYDEGHRNVFLRQAYIHLTRGLSLGVDQPAQPFFERHRSAIAQRMSADYLRDGINLDSFPMGRSKKEKQYRHWCLENRLFLNPLNDLGPFSIAARDVFTTPSMIAAIGEGPHFQGFFNQLKQEFVSARFFCHEGRTSAEPHFADKEVLLFNTLDYPSYSLAVERMKAAFRMAYSLFDKIAYFLNEYLRLGIPERNVSFRTLWYEDQQKKKGLKAQFHQFRNWPLRGLFWLSKDLYEDEPEFREAIEPDARALNEIRNHAEHKYLKIHDLWSKDCGKSTESNPLVDRLAYSIGRHDFEAKARTYSPSGKGRARLFVPRHPPGGATA